MNGERCCFETRSIMAIASVILSSGSVLRTINPLTIGIAAENQWVSLFDCLSWKMFNINLNFTDSIEKTKFDPFQST